MLKYNRSINQELKMNRKIFFIVILSLVTMQAGFTATNSNNTPLATCLETFGAGCIKFERCTSTKCNEKETCTLENNNYVCENTTLKDKKKTIHPKSYLPKELDNTITYHPVSIFQEHTNRIMPRQDISFNQYHNRYTSTNGISSGNFSFGYGRSYPVYRQTSVFTSGNDLHSPDRHNAVRNYEKSKFNNLLDYKSSKVKSRLNAF